MSPEEHLVHFWLLCWFCKMFKCCLLRQKADEELWRMETTVGEPVDANRVRIFMFEKHTGKKKKVRSKTDLRNPSLQDKRLFFSSFAGKIHHESAEGHSKTDPRICCDKQSRHQSHHQLQHGHSSSLRYKMRPRRQPQPKGQFARATVNTEIFILLLQ